MNIDLDELLEGAGPLKIVTVAKWEEVTGSYKRRLDDLQEDYEYLLTEIEHLERQLEQ